jgi:hypothetical protein
LQRLFRAIETDPAACAFTLTLTVRPRPGERYVKLSAAYMFVLVHSLTSNAIITLLSDAWQHKLRTLSSSASIGQAEQFGLGWSQAQGQLPKSANGSLRSVVERIIRFR